jgi:hypothetical protein
MGGTVALPASLNRVGVVRASPRRRAIAGLEDINQAKHRSVGASDHQESTDDDHKAGPADHELPPHSAAVGSVPVVVEPHGTHRLETHESTEDGTHERDETTEGGDAAGNAVGDEGGATDAAEPRNPVDHAVGGEVLGVAECADEDVFGGQVGVQDHGDTQTGKRKTVGNLLHERTGRSESRRGNIRSTVVVNNNADDEVGANGDTTAEGERPDVLLRVPHLRCDGEVCGYTGEGEDEGRDSRHSLGEGRVTEEFPVRGEVSSLGSLSRAILNASGDSHTEDGGEDGEHADPGEPADLAQCADAGNTESDDGGDCDEDGGAGTVGRDGI